MAVGESRDEAQARLPERLAELDRASAAVKARESGLNQSSIGPLTIGLAIIAVCVGIWLLSKCAGNVGSGPAAASGQPVASTSAADNEPPPPTHLWKFKDGQDYGYTTELSEDQRNAGQAASQVLLFRYLGIVNGRYKIIQPNNGLGMVATCKNPCQIIEVTNLTPFGVNVQHLEFNPSSVIGAAFSDAINGQMEVYGSDAGQAPSAPAPISPAPQPSPAKSAPSIVPDRQAATDQPCYKNGARVTLRGTATIRDITSPGGAIKTVWILKPTGDPCAMQALPQSPMEHPFDIEAVQIIGSPPPLDVPIELTGTLDTGKFTGEFAEPMVLRVEGGRKIRSASESPTTSDNAPME